MLNELNDPYKIRRTLELYGHGRFDIENAVKLPDGDRLITVYDKENPQEEPVTYVQSHIPTLQDDDVRSFLLRQLIYIQGEWYDD